jgi:hypothetical protein
MPTAAVAAMTVARTVVWSQVTIVVSFPSVSAGFRRIRGAIVPKST